jgi:hypothetical protein
MKPKLYYKVNENGVPFDNFCSDAAIGANEAGISCIAFSDIKTVPKNPYHIVVTSVEESLQWLEKDVQAIDDSWAKHFKNRAEKILKIEEIENYPCFIKPYKQIKAFTGIIVNNKEEAKLFTQDFKESVSCQEIVEFESEWRVYVNKDRGILGIKHYLGDPYIIPQKSFVDEVVKAAKKELKENSYTLDLGIDKNLKNYLIEVNDGWAIGNYGLPPTLYYSFIKSRWLQLTGVLV